MLLACKLACVARTFEPRFAVLDVFTCGCSAAVLETGRDLVRLRTCPWPEVLRVAPPSVFELAAVAVCLGQLPRPPAAIASTSRRTSHDKGRRHPRGVLCSPRLWLDKGCGAPVGFLVTHPGPVGLFLYHPRHCAYSCQRCVLGLSADTRSCLSILLMCDTRVMPYALPSSPRRVQLEPSDLTDGSTQHDPPVPLEPPAATRRFKRPAPTGQRPSWRPPARPPWPRGRPRPSYPMRRRPAPRINARTAPPAVSHELHSRRHRVGGGRARRPRRAARRPKTARPPPPSVAGAGVPAPVGGGLADARKWATHGPEEMPLAVVEGPHRGAVKNRRDAAPRVAAASFVAGDRYGVRARARGKFLGPPTVRQTGMTVWPESSGSIWCQIVVATAWAASSYSRLRTACRAPR